VDHFIIRKAGANDAEALFELYTYHLAENPPKDALDIALWQKLLVKFEVDRNYHLLVGEYDGRIVSSVTLIIIENLTHGIRPYAVMENVVTHADFRGNGFASALISHACGIAEAAGCYKIMLLTGSKKESTLKFYESNGFDRNAKTAFLIRL